MLKLIFSARDLAMTRFAFSPLWEVVASVRVLNNPSAHALHLPWVREVRPRLAGTTADLAPLLELIPRTGRVLPGFLAPTPTAASPELAAELDDLKHTDGKSVRAELENVRSGVAERMRGDPVGGLSVLAAAIEAYWAAAIEPWWPRIQSVLEGDVLYRARSLAESGSGGLLNEIDPAIRWGDDRLTVDHPLVADTRTLDGRGLVLVPSAFIWPDVASKTSDPWQPVLRYSARGIATLWERSNSEDADLAAVIGRTRAQLLAMLESPASTTELARRTGLSAGGVSQQLTALRKGGLVAAHRTGRVVLYVRSPRGDALMSSRHVPRGDA